MPLQNFFICATKGENLERKDSNLKDLRNTRKWTTTFKRCMKKAKENWIGEQCSEIEENMRKNNSKRAYQLMKDKGKLLLSKIVQENVWQKNERSWTDGQNIALSCSITRPTEILQNWTVPRQTQRTTTQSFGEKWRLQYNHWKKGSQLELTTS